MVTSDGVQPAIGPTSSWTGIGRGGSAGAGHVQGCSDNTHTPSKSLLPTVLLVSFPHCHDRLDEWAVL